MSKYNKKPIEGIAVFSGKINGTVILKENENDNSVKVVANLSGLPSNKKLAWHIHESGDLREKSCSSAGSHYNPFNKNHAGPHEKERHVGDLGNLSTNANGNSKSSVIIHDLKLRGKYSVIGRSLVIHALPDDMGKGGTEESLKTGSAGSRIACAVIGYSQKSQLYF